MIDNLQSLPRYDELFGDNVPPPKYEDAIKILLHPIFLKQLMILAHNRNLGSNEITIEMPTESEDKQKQDNRLCSCNGGDFK